MTETKKNQIAVYRSNQCLIVPIQVELESSILEDLQENVLREIHSSQEKPRGVVIDLSGVKIIDLFLAEYLVKLAKMVQLLGVRSVLSGLKAAQASSLVNLGFEKAGMVFLRTLDISIDYLQGKDNG
jgi:rsbT antagonist protein RsbS